MAKTKIQRAFAVMRSYRLPTGKLPKDMQEPASKFLAALRSKNKVKTAKTADNFISSSKKTSF